MKHKLHLFVFLFLLIGSLAHAQSNYESDANEAFAAGLYKQAHDLYRKAARTNPSSDLTYKMGEASRMANNYADAIGYYREIANSLDIVNYPDCLYHLGIMYRCNGQVDSAAYWLNRYLQTMPDNEAYKSRARQESRACEWIKDNENKQQNVVYGVTHESKNINTANYESGAVLVGDSLLVYSSMQELSAPGSKNAVNMDLVLMQLYQAPVSGNGKPGPSVVNNWGLNHKDAHTGNIAIDDFHKAIYFTRSENRKKGSFSEIINHIYVAVDKNGRWLKPKKLGGDINIDGYSSTHPSVVGLEDGSTLLYFSSNRPGGEGGFDLWYTVISPEGDIAPVKNLGSVINTEGNEITPYYCEECHSLYFSSDWHFGFGGYDVFVSHGNMEQWDEPMNLGSSLNSPANDIYFTVNPGRPNSGYFTSNRRGSYFISDNTCCNDIYRWSSKRPVAKKKEEPKPIAVSMKGAVHALLPISLYFHNDTPDPKSELYTTKQTYFQTYNRYMFMRQQYKNAFEGIKDEYTRDLMLYEIDNFFDHEVHDNCLKFEELINLLIDDLKSGKRVRITVEGYASPVHNSKYNQKISQRRVGSIVNQLMEYDHGRLKPFIGSKGEGSLQIREVAYGSSRAAEGVSTDRSNSANSVYSVDASRERRIEILDYQYLEDDSTLISCLNIPQRAVNIGSFQRGEQTEVQVRIPHTAIYETSLDFISCGNPDVKVLGYTKLVPGRELVVYLRMDNRKVDPVVSAFLPLTLRVKDEQVTQTMFLEYSITK